MATPRFYLQIKQPADRFGFENSLWNSKRIKLVFQKKLKLKISLSTVLRSLRDLRLSYQKPERRALEQDPKKRKFWIEKEWPKMGFFARIPEIVYQGGLIL